MHRFLLVLAATALAFFAEAKAHAQERLGTCVLIESDVPDKEALRRLVESEVERHPSHHTTTDGCATHLRIELIEIGGERYLTGRVAGEVPDRVHVEGKSGKALEAAVVQLLRVVLGNDPRVLKAPEAHTWLSDRILALRDHARNRFDLAAIEGFNLVSGKPAFTPGIQLGYAREVADLQIGVEASVLQELDSHPGKLGLDTQIRLHGVVAYYLSSEADVAGFVGASIGLDHQRFSGPRAPSAGKGDTIYFATGPALGLRAGVELFRTTTARAFVLGEIVLPAIFANDRDGEIVKGWFPGLNLGAGIGF